MNKIIRIMMAMILAMAFMPAGILAQETTLVQNVQFTDIEPYAGSVPPGHFLYRFKLMFENVDEAITLDPVKKMDKKLAHARTRLAEAKMEIAQNRTNNAEQAINRYRSKMYEVTNNMESIAEDDISEEMQTGLQNAQLRVEHHALILQGLAESQPDNVGLQVAVMNTEQLRNRFEEHLDIHINGVIIPAPNQTQSQYGHVGTMGNNN